MQISKSEYIMYLKHPAWLWLKKHDKSKLPQIDDNLQAMFDAGNLFEEYAEKLFPDGVKLGFDGYYEYLALTEKTKKEIESGAETIFQARFEANEITCICDVLKKVGENTFDLYEIKSSTKVKIDHIHDLAFQRIVIEKAGYIVKNVYVVHVNNEYVRNGKINFNEITSTVDVTKQVEDIIESTKKNITEALEVAAQPTIPDTSPAKCGLNSTQEWIKVHKELNGIKEGDGSIYDFYNPNAELVGKLAEAGIDKIANIPLDFKELSDKQRWQLEALNKNEIIVDKKRVKGFLDSVKYPIYFLDYETLSSVIPRFDGHMPYQQVPFQYSLHIIDESGAELKHVEYLHSDNSDPVESLSKSLKENIGDKGTVFVWWESFEKNRNIEMGEMFPEFEDFYKDINSRIIDLIEPFYKFYYVDKRFGGSSSIKDVLPVIAPELSYEDLDISEGNSAQRLWMDVVLDGKNPDQKEKVLKDLWKYCELDTLAMVKIWEFLIKTTK